MKCPHCNIGPMFDLGFGYFQCRLVDVPHIPKNLDLKFFHPKCLLSQKFG